MKKKLADDVLLRRSSIPEKLCDVCLKGQFVTLKPLDIERDVKPLYDVSCGKPITFGMKVYPAYDADLLIWRYMFDGPFETEVDFAKSLCVQKNAPNGLCMTVFDNESCHQIGVANFMNTMPQHLKIELGGIWYSPIAQRTHANLEATCLMLQHAFFLGFRRVEWKCDVENQRSIKSAKRMGFTFEGIQESHFIVKDCNRDTAWFRMLSSEWPQVKITLKSLLQL